MDIKKIKIGNTSYDVKDSVARSRLMAGDSSVELVSGSAGTVYANMNTYYLLGDTSTNLLQHATINLPAAPSARTFLINNCGGAPLGFITFHFKTGSSPQITFSSGSSAQLKYFKGFSIEANTEYEINCMFDALRAEWIIAYGIIE